MATELIAVVLRRKLRSVELKALPLGIIHALCTLVKVPKRFIITIKYLHVKIGVRVIMIRIRLELGLGVRIRVRVRVRIKVGFTTRK